MKLPLPPSRDRVPPARGLVDRRPRWGAPAPLDPRPEPDRVGDRERPALGDDLRDPVSQPGGKMKNSLPSGSARDGPATAAPTGGSRRGQQVVDLRPRRPSAPGWVAVRGSGTVVEVEGHPLVGRDPGDRPPVVARAPASASAPNDLAPPPREPSGVGAVDADAVQAVRRAAGRRRARTRRTRCPPGRPSGSSPGRSPPRGPRRRSPERHEVVDRRRSRRRGGRRFFTT